MRYYIHVMGLSSNLSIVLYPYNTLPKTSSNEKFLYLLIDNTPRIPVSHKFSLLNWADQKSKLIEEKTFGGILVQKRELN